MTDFTFSFATFNATTILLVAKTSKAQEYLTQRFGSGSLSVEILKSAAPYFAESLESQGFILGYK
jgi:hypothetical protein